MSTTQVTIISREGDTLEVNGEATLVTSAKVSESPSGAAALLSAVLDAQAPSHLDRPAVALSSTCNTAPAGVMR